MKIILLLAVLIVSSLNAQSVEVTPNGLVDAQGPTIKYCIINEEGTAQELRNKVLRYLNTVYESPRDVLL